MAREGCPPSLPMLYTRGSHFDVGHATGSTFGDRIRRYMFHDTTISQTVRALYDSREGRQLCDILRRTGEDNFPQYAAEIRGLAAGVGVSYEDMLLHNLTMYSPQYVARTLSTRLEGEQWSDSKNGTDPQESCSTVFLNRKEVKVIGHNEDGNQAVSQYAYMLSACIDDPDFPPIQEAMTASTTREPGSSTDAAGDSKAESLETFTAYCWPGILHGIAFGFNGHGLVFSSNSQIFDNAPCGAPGFCIARSLLTAASIQQCRHLLENSQRGGGSSAFSVNIADVKCPKLLWTAEMQPGLRSNQVHMHPVAEADLKDNGCYFQTNAFQHLPNCSHLPSLNRPLARLSRAKELLPWLDERDVLRVLGDTHCGNRFCIFRRANTTDSGNTAATALFDIMGKRLDVYVDNPKTNLPLMSFPIVRAFPAKLNMNFTRDTNPIYS